MVPNSWMLSFRIVTLILKKISFVTGRISFFHFLCLILCSMCRFSDGWGISWKRFFFSSSSPTQSLDAQYSLCYSGGAFTPSFRKKTYALFKIFYANHESADPQQEKVKTKESKDTITPIRVRHFA